MDFERNNLDRAASPYLRGHRENPVFWQEWRPEALAYAARTGRILFVSSGYSACHWCHVMAGEAFSDPAVAAFLNRHFVSLKIDREERPDIDRFLMDILVRVSGSGGWPLNVFLSPDLRPVTALTYAPPVPRDGRPPFLEVLERVKSFYDRDASRLKPFRMAEPSAQPIAEGELVDRLFTGFDEARGGFGAGAKFPPHSQLLFALYCLDFTSDRRLDRFLRTTLDAMLRGGLHDHLQGGFYRYCVDRSWTIPHFEKMLADQALLLWAYALAAGHYDDPGYRRAAAGIIRCLEETFAAGGLFHAAHDADVEHREGAAYLWREDQLRRLLTAAEFEVLARAYEISPRGNFEGANHLVRLPGERPEGLGEIEEKLLAARRKRRQPFRDRTILTAQNCLAGIGLVQASRYLGRREHLEAAGRLHRALVARHLRAGRLAHASCGADSAGGQFMEDYAAMLLFLTFLHEETGGCADGIEHFRSALLAFRRAGRWLEADNPDFRPVAAARIDHAMPASFSLARLALVRADLLAGREPGAAEYPDSALAPFLGISALAANGWFHLVRAPRKIDWRRLPLNTIQVRGDEMSACWRGACRRELPRRKKVS